jgi:D-glycero-alpha-D-manno-heptose-7-phosphate kinase
VSLNLFLIAEIASLREALLQIEANNHGIILTTNPSGVVSGLATDGDIRRKLIDGAALDDPISSCANPNFVWADQATPRELLLKQLDNRIRFIPLLDSTGKLTAIVSRDHFPIWLEEKVYARARAPVRISFGGGGSDLTHFFAGDVGAVINTTISLYSHATLRMRDDALIIDPFVTWGVLFMRRPAMRIGPAGSFGLISGTVSRQCTLISAFELYLHSDFPMNSGLGGSAAVSSAVLGCFNQFRQDRWDYMNSLSWLFKQSGCTLA